jgi:hypothetical protein
VVGWCNYKPTIACAMKGEHIRQRFHSAVNVGFPPGARKSAPRWIDPLADEAVRFLAVSVTKASTWRSCSGCSSRHSKAPGPRLYEMKPLPEGYAVQFIRD